MPADADQWRELVKESVARGVEWRRLRVVPEPLTGYLRWEHHLTESLNVAPGEQVRWLPRRRTVQFQHLSPDPHGTGIIDHGDEVTNDPDVVNRTIAAFDMAWDHDIPHADYRPD